MAARTSLKQCIVAAVENFHFHQYPSLAIVRHTRGKYYSLLQPTEFDNLPTSQDPEESYIVFLGTQKELFVFFSFQADQFDMFKGAADRPEDNH